MEELKLQDFITIPCVNEAVNDKTMTEKEAVKYVTNTSAGVYFADLYDSSSDDSSDDVIIDDSSDDIIVDDSSDDQPVTLVSEPESEPSSDDQGIGVE